MAEGAKSLWSEMAPYLGIGASLIWNFVNYRRTSKIRTATIDMDELKRLRAPIDALCVELKALLGKVKSLDASARTKAALKAEIEEINKEIVQINNKMISALTDIDISGIVQGKDWLLQYEVLYEALVGSLERIYAHLEVTSEFKKRAEAIVSTIEAVLSYIFRRLEAELKRISSI